MSDRIDELFRDSMNQTPEATPPPGQWEKIRKRELIVGPTRPVATWKWLVFGLLLGLLCAGPLGYYLGSEACGAQPQDAGEVVAAELVSKPVLPPVITAVTPAQEKLEEQGKTIISAPKKASKATVPSPSSSAPEDLPRTGVRAPEFPVLPTFTTPDFSGQETNTTPNTDYTYLPKSIAQKPGASLPDPMLPFARYELGQYSKSAGIIVPNLPTKLPNPTGRWEASLHFMPWVTLIKGSVQVLSSNDNGSTPREVEFNGEQRALYPSGSISPNPNRQLRLQVVSLEMGRQFPNGMRLGLGVFLYPSHWNYIRDDTELFNSQLLEDEWATYFSSESESLSLSLTAGYTFRRRKRLRPYLGLFLGSRFYREGTLREHTFRRSDRSLSIRQISSYRNSADFGDLFLFAQAGLQYQISERLSVGLEIVPGIGVGGRYRF